MRFRLSTILLMTALFAVAIGWFTDRHQLSQQLQQLKQARSERDRQIYLGAVMMGTSSGKFEVFDRFDFHDIDDDLVHIKNDAKYQRVMAEECVAKLLNIYDHQAEIEMVGALVSGSWDARLNARSALEILKCDDAERFFEIAKSLDEFDSPELGGPDSAEFRSLHRFISDTLAVKDEWYFNGFENDPRDR